MRESAPARALAAALLAGVALSAAGPAGGADWPQWRGPGHSGVTPESSGFPAGWPPRPLWGANVGAGCTSPVLAGGRLYVMGWRGRGKGNPLGADTVRCFDARTGELLWKQTYPCRYQGRFRVGDTGSYGGPSSTPTFDSAGGRLYTLSVDGDLRCWDAARGGREVWGLNLYEKYQVRRRPIAGKGRRDYGYTGSPLVRGDVVIVAVGGDEGTLMAFDKATGGRRWVSALKGPAGHTAGPVPLSVRGVECIATLTLTKLVVMRADAGREGTTLAGYPWRTDYSCNLATPAAADGKLVLTSSYNQSGTALVEIAAEGVRRRWTSRHHALLSSPVVHKGRVYFVHGRLYCLELATGKLRWRGGDFGHGSCLATGDDKLIVFGKGRLAVVDALAGEYRELARAEKVVPGTCYPHVALAGGVLCCKDRAGNLVCFSVGQPRE